jgi:hypothetical protein
MHVPICILKTSVFYTFLFVIYIATVPKKKAFSKCKFKSMGSNLGFVTLAAGEIEY